MTFDDAFELIIGHEGGYSNDSRDNGGETNWGISQKAYPNLHIPSLTKDQAKHIYKSDYWDAIKGDYLPGRLATLVFDCAVNQGVGAATKMMQKSLGVNADGVIGPKTLSAAQSADLSDFAVKFGAERGLRYGQHEDFLIYGRGWMRRLLKTTLQVANV